MLAPAHIGSALSYIATIFALNAFPLVLVLPFLRRGRLTEHTGRQWVTGALGGVFSIGAYGLVIWAMTRGAIASIAALRETSVIFAALIGTLFLGEPFGRHRVAAAAGVAAGVILLRTA